MRELERRWRESGDVEAEAAWLRARVKVKEVPLHFLRLAACVGHEASCLAFGADVGDDEWVAILDGEVDFLPPSGRRSTGVEYLGPSVCLCLRAALPLARSILWAAPAAEHGRAAEVALKRMEGCVIEPTEARRQRVTAVVDSLPDCPDRWAAAGATAVRYAYYQLIEFRPELVEEAEERPPYAFRWFAKVLERQKATSEGLAALRADLVPHLLKTGDPVRARVLARRSTS